MGLFQKRREEHSEIQYRVSYGLEKTKLIVGLGNPGTQYELTRHNIGFLVADALVKAENGSWSEKKALKSLVSELKVGTVRLVVVKPQTFMNLSGEAVQAVQRFYKLTNQDTVVVYDELDIPFGQIRTRAGGSAAGHNGVKSLIQHLGEDFGRIRVGIGPKIPAQMDSADFVLQKFSKAEQENLKALHAEAIAILNESIFGGELKPETRKFIL